MPDSPGATDHRPSTQFATTTPGKALRARSAVTIGLIVNVTSTILFLVLITRDQPWAALLVGYGPLIG